MWSADQAPPEICEFFLHQFPPIRAELDATFVMEMSIFVSYRLGACGLWSRLWSGFEKKSPARRTKGKADYRDAPLAFFYFLTCTF
jgi:hypothetical protein